jgi:hypothetical protein
VRLQRRYLKQLPEGVLYTHRDFTYKTHEEVGTDIRFIKESEGDPIKRLNINPVHEFKVALHHPPSPDSLELQHVIRIRHLNGPHHPRQSHRLQRQKPTQGLQSH